MIGRPCAARHLTCLLFLLVLGAITVGAASQAWARKMTLPDLLQMARGNPGLQASAAATSASEAQVTEAKLNWLPQGDLLSILAPSPNLHCTNPFFMQSTAANPMPMNPTGTSPTEPCVETLSPEARITDVSWNRVFTRTEVKLIQPVYDFGKISAGIAAAEAGVGVSRQKEAGARADIELNVRKAYYGLKFAREVIDMLDEGSGYVDDALKKLDKDLANGTGNVSVTDRLRMRTVRAELDARILEAKRLQGIARESLRTLLGPEAPADLDVDDEEFEPPEVKDRIVTYYEDLARANRPEVRMLEYAVRAKSALADLERRKEYPDFVLIASGAFAYAQTVDDPQNAYYNHYFNSRSAGIAAALRMQLDLGPKIARARKSEAEALEIAHRRSEALGGILLEVRKSYTEANEAASRVIAMDKGQKAGKAWISAVAQNFAVGLAEARDLSDALVAFFGMRTRYLQAVFDLHMARSALSRATGSTEL